MTSDFAMQNVALQMGIPLLTPDGQRITHIKSFVLECYACYTIERDPTKKFCSGCGNDTLLKLTVSINQDGSMTCYRKKGFKVKTKGFVYPMPENKGGRKNVDLITCEDQFLMGQRKWAMKKRQKKEER